MEILKPYRKRIDDLDDRIIDLLAERIDVIREVAALKTELGIPAVLQDRVDEVRERCIARGVEKGLDADFVRDLYVRIISYSCDLEDSLICGQTDGVEKKTSSL
jgi:chorismate mutase